MLDHGADVAAAEHNGETALMLAAGGTDVPAAAHSGVTALVAAAAGGHGAVAIMLLGHGADVAGASHDDFTVLMFAAEDLPRAEDRDEDPAGGEMPKDRGDTLPTKRSMRPLRAPARARKRSCATPPALTSFLLRRRTGTSCCRIRGP